MYDDWKAREPGPDGIGCLECKTEEARPGSNYCCEACERSSDRWQRTHALESLGDERQQELDDAYSATGQDEWAIGRKIRWMHQEAIRRGWLLGPA